jgi:hypothetical protein
MLSRLNYLHLLQFTFDHVLDPNDMQDNNSRVLFINLLPSLQLGSFTYL